MREELEIDLQAYRETSLQTWGEVAPAWEDRRAWMLKVTGAVNEWLVDQVDPQPGETILDIGAGTGDLGFAAAARVGESGRVICTDFAPQMIDAARRNGDRSGLTNVDFRVLDAERMDLGDDTADGVLSRWSYMLMADPGAALGETRRVLRDGGTLAFAVWQAPDRNPWAALPGMIMVQRGHMPPPEPGAPGIFTMGEPDRIRELVAAAGFEEPALEQLTFEWRYSADDLWDTLTRLAGAMAKVIRELSEEEARATRTAVEESLEQFRDGDELVVPAACWGVTTR